MILSLITNERLLIIRTYLLVITYITYLLFRTQNHKEYICIPDHYDGLCGDQY